MKLEDLKKAYPQQVPEHHRQAILQAARRAVKGPAQRPRVPWRAWAFAGAVVLALFASVLLPHPAFRTQMPADKQQYQVFGLQQTETGTARAHVIDKGEAFDLRVNSLEDIPVHMGYDVALPAWLPAGYQVSAVYLTRDEQMDEVLIVYEGDAGSITVGVSHYESREGMGTSYEQVGPGREVTLQNGTRIYMAHNINSVWGLYQTDSLDYYINAVNQGEDVLLRMFNAIPQ